jgi:hypothetical protein
VWFLLIFSDNRQGRRQILGQLNDKEGMKSLFLKVQM